MKRRAWLAGLLPLLLRLLHRFASFFTSRSFLASPKTISDSVFPGSAHDGIPAETLVGAQDDFHLRPGESQPLDDALNLSSAPAAASIFEGRSRAQTRCSSMKTYSGR